MLGNVPFATGLKTLKNVILCPDYNNLLMSKREFLDCAFDRIYRLITNVIFAVSFWNIIIIKTMSSATVEAQI